MEVKNCKSCGRLFNYLGGIRLCPVCKDELEKKFLKVRDYIRSHPKTTLKEIADENEVDIEQINQWIREERLEFSKDSPVLISCENCGAPIRTGRFCQKCKSTMANSLTDAFKRPEMPKPKKKESDGDKMRFLGGNS